MSEINEDNCVLDDGELKRLLCALNYYSRGMTCEEEEENVIIYSKINKLNEMAKELREMEDEAPTAYRLLYKEKQK